MPDALPRVRGISFSRGKSEKRGFAYPRYPREIKAGEVSALAIVLNNSGLKRYAPLRSFVPLKRLTPLRPQSTKSRAKHRAWARVKREAIERAGGRCVVRVPGVCTGEAIDGHHIRPRGQGGKDTPENIAVCCRSCHQYLHDHPKWAYERGWLVAAPPRGEVGRG